VAKAKQAPERLGAASPPGESTKRLLPVFRPAAMLPEVEQRPAPRAVDLAEDAADSQPAGKTQMCLDHPRNQTVVPAPDPDAEADVGLGAKAAETFRAAMALRNTRSIRKEEDKLVLPNEAKKQLNLLSTPFCSVADMSWGARCEKSARRVLTGGWGGDSPFLPDLVWLQTALAG